MFTNFCEVQIDAASYDHFKYPWSSLRTTPRLSDLKRILIQKLNNRELFCQHSKYDLFDASRYGRRIFDGNNRRLNHKEKFSLKTKDGKLFYAQAIGNESNSGLFEQLKQDTQKLQKEIEEQIKFRRTQSINDEKLKKEIKEQMEKEYAKINDNLNTNITKESIESSYKIILTQKCNFDEKKAIIGTLNRKYQKLYKKVKKEYDRIKDKHFEELKDPTIKQLILLGKTGDGKSTFANRLCGDISECGNKGPFKSTNDVQSVTQRIQKWITEIGCDRVAVVDTPGAFDSNGAIADWEHAQDLVKYLKGCGGVNAFVVVCKPPRLDGTFLQMLKNLTIMLGREFWDHVIFVVTHLKMNEDSNIEEKKEESEPESESEDEDDEYDEINEKSPQEWLREFSLIVRGKFDLPANQPYCIGVENRNSKSYMSTIEEVMNSIKQEKFECDKIKSPFDDKKRELQTFFDEIQFALDSMRQIRNTMLIIERQIINQIVELQQDDGNYRPSFPSLDVKRMTEMEAIDFKDIEMIDREIMLSENEEEKYDMAIGMSFVSFANDVKVADRNCIDNGVVRASNISSHDFVGISDDSDMELEDDAHYHQITTVIQKNSDIVSHFITALTISNDRIIIKVSLKHQTSKTESFYIYECGKENNNHVAQFRIRKGENEAIQELDLDKIENKAAFSIALYRNEHDLFPISNQLLLSVPDGQRVVGNYKPNSILLASVQAIEHNNDIYVYFSIPQLLRGDNIAFKIKYIDDNQGNDYVSNPFILSKSLMPISFQIVTSSTIEDKEYLSNPSDIITIGYEGVIQHQEENEQVENKDDEDEAVDELVEYLQTIGFVEYANTFRDNGFETLDDLKEEADGITQQDLKEMGIVKLGHQKKFLRALHSINSKENNEMAPPVSPPPAYAPNTKDIGQQEGVNTGYIL